MKNQESISEKETVSLGCGPVVNANESKYPVKRSILLILSSFFICIVFYLIDGEYKNGFDKGEFLLIAIYTLIGSIGAYLIYQLLKNRTRHASLISFVSIPFCIGLTISILILFLV